MWRYRSGSCPVFEVDLFQIACRQADGDAVLFGLVHYIGFFIWIWDVSNDKFRFPLRPFYEVLLRLVMYSSLSRHGL